MAERRQTMLFSATQTRKIEDLARVSLKKEPLYVGVDDRKDQATVDGLEQVQLLYFRLSSLTITLISGPVYCSLTRGIFTVTVGNHM